MFTAGHIKRSIKQTALLVLALVVGLTSNAQQAELRTDEECGCELFFIDGIQTFRQGDLFGFRLEDGTELVPAIYSYVDRFHNGYCKVYLENEKCGLIDRTGREVVPCIYDDVLYPAEGRVVVVQDYAAGYCDLQGNEIVKPQYPQGASFSCGAAAVQLSNGRCAFIDTLGRQLFGRTFDNVRPFNEGYALVREDGHWGVLDRNGHLTLPTQFESVTENKKGLFLAGKIHRMALYDYNMKPLTDTVYSGTLGTSEGRVSVVRNGKYGFVDRTGREVVPCIYDETGLFQQGRTLVRLGDRYGIVDTTGRIVLPIEYANTHGRGFKYTYFDGRALVEKDGHLSFVDLEGRLILPMVLEDAYQFSDGLAAVKHNGLWGYIDTAGDIFMPCIFDIASPYQWGRAEVVYNGQVSKVDRKGRCVKNCNGIIAWREQKE